VAEAYFLSESDKAAIQGLLTEASARRVGTTGRQGSESVDHEEHQAPEVYVARIPAGGIPGLSLALGTSIVDEPGHAECDIYRVVPVSAGVGDVEIRVVEGLKRRVYNLLQVAITGGRWALVTRDKFGFWMADAPAIWEFFKPVFFVSGGLYVGLIVSRAAGAGGAEVVLASSVYGVPTDFGTTLNTLYPARYLGVDSNDDPYWLFHVPGDVCSLLRSLPGYNPSAVQILGHDVTGGCAWFNTTPCP
jgi:hypothetical protein